MRFNCNAAEFFLLWFLYDPTESYVSLTIVNPQQKERYSVNALEFCRERDNSNKRLGYRRYSYSFRQK